jgi:hypothetical protein
MFTKPLNLDTKLYSQQKTCLSSTALDSKLYPYIEFSLQPRTLVDESFSVA